MKPIELFEVYYHDAWRTNSTYTREHIASSAESAKQWLMENLNDWYDDHDEKIHDVVEQGLNQDFLYMTVTKITINDDGSVEWM